MNSPRSKLLVIQFNLSFMSKWSTFSLQPHPCPSPSRGWRGVWGEGLITNFSQQAAEGYSVLIIPNYAVSWGVGGYLSRYPDEIKTMIRYWILSLEI